MTRKNKIFYTHVRKPMKINGILFLLLFLGIRHLRGMEQPLRITYDKDWRDEYILPEDYDRNLPRDEDETPINVDRYGVCHNNTSRTRVRYRGARSTEIDPRTDMREMDLRMKIITGLSAVDRDLREGNFSGTTFKDCDLTGSNLSGCIFADTKFINCKMDCVKIHTDELFYNVTLENTSAIEIKFGGTHIQNSTFRKVNLTGAVLSQIQITNSFFIECNLDKALMNGAIISGTLFCDIHRTKGLDLSKSTISGCSFIFIAFNGVNLSESRFLVGTRGNFINKCVFVFTDLNDIILNDTLITDTYITYPWDSTFKFSETASAMSYLFYGAATPMVNSLKYIFIPPIPVLNGITWSISAYSKTIGNTNIQNYYTTARCRFKYYEPPVEAIARETDCLNLHRTKSANGLKTYNLFGLSDNMEELLKELGAEMQMDRPRGISPDGIINLIAIYGDNKEKEEVRSEERQRQRDNVTRLENNAAEDRRTNESLNTRLQAAYGYMSGAGINPTNQQQ